MSTEQAIEISQGELTTTDGVTVRLSANLSYRIVDIEANWRTISDQQTTIKCNAHGLLMTTCAAYAWGDLTRSRAEIEGDALLAIRAMAAPWGVEVIRLNLTDMAQPRQFIIVGEAGGGGSPRIVPLPGVAAA